jgi:hypothetical protein
LFLSVTLLPYGLGGEHLWHRDQIWRRAAWNPQRLGEVKRHIRRPVDAIADGSAPALSVRDRLAELESEKATLEAPAPVEPTISIHPAAIERYLGQVEALASELRATGTIAAGSPSAIFRELVDAVVVHAVPARSPLHIELRGHLSALLGDPKLAPHGRYSGFERALSGRGRETPVERSLDEMALFRHSRRCRAHCCVSPGLLVDGPDGTPQDRACIMAKREPPL